MTESPKYGKVPKNQSFQSLCLNGAEAPGSLRGFDDFCGPLGEFAFHRLVCGPLDTFGFRHSRNMERSLKPIFSEPLWE